MNIVKDVISKYGENLSWLPERMHKGLPQVYYNIANRGAARKPNVIKDYPEYFKYDMDYAGIMNKVADHYLVESTLKRDVLTCDAILADCSYEGEPFDCCSVFEKVYGHYGPLFTFNSLISHSTNITGKLKFDLKTNSYKSPPALKYQINPNKMALGLKFRLKQEAFVGVTHPMAIWERTKARNLFTKYNYELYVNDVVEVQSSEDIPNIPAERRDCVFQGELPLLYHGLYHPTVCVEEMERAKEMEICGCTVYNYPPDERFPYCNNSRLACLASGATLPIKLYLFLTPRIEVRSATPDVLSRARYAFSGTRPFPNHLACSLGKDNSTSGHVKIAFMKLPTFHFKRNILFTWMDLLVSFGGTLSLFLGASVISLVEVLYILLKPLIYKATNTKH
uniref:Uncharacterized protein n=1 Tax=Timema poppense TaxID=170557 RepID=A0A7R9CRF3_TIMPO|nr:unnamed protein product [Timema poppensis]